MQDTVRHQRETGGMKYFGKGVDAKVQSAHNLISLLQRRKRRSGGDSEVLVVRFL